MFVKLAAIAIALAFTATIDHAVTAEMKPHSASCSTNYGSTQAPDGSDLPLVTTTCAKAP